MSAVLRSTALMASGLGLLLTTGCAGSSLQESLQADPQLQDRPVFTGEAPEATAEPKPEAIAPPQETPEVADRPTPPAASNTALLSEVPEDLRPYVETWLALGIVEPAASPSAAGSATAPKFQPNQPITRGEFADWLLTTNNRFYQDVPAKRIRPATANTTSAFQDVPPSHPYFAAIQGLAEAGIIPSAKTGNATAVTFRPEAPLTRETLALWKVPLDTRAALPTANAEAVTTTWGFQDAAKIEPLALRAVLADYQTGDFSNIRRAFGYTTLFQPQKSVTQAEAAAALWRFGTQTDGISAEALLNQAPPSQPSSEQPNSPDSAERPRKTSTSR